MEKRMKNNKNEYVNTFYQNNMCYERCGSITAYNYVNDQITFTNARICMMNPLSIVDFDLKMFPENCYFISDLFVKQNYAVLFYNDDDEDKKQFCDFIKKLQYRVFQGKKEINNYVC